jgi:hypothetical protein
MCLCKHLARKSAINLSDRMPHKCSDFSDWNWPHQIHASRISGTFWCFIYVRAAPASGHGKPVGTCNLAWQRTTE